MASIKTEEEVAELTDAQKEKRHEEEAKPRKERPQEKMRRAEGEILYKLHHPTVMIHSICRTYDDGNESGKALDQLRNFLPKKQRHLIADWKANRKPPDEDDENDDDFEFNDDDPWVRKQKGYRILAEVSKAIYEKNQVKSKRRQDAPNYRQAFMDSFEGHDTDVDWNEKWPQVDIWAPTEAEHGGLNSQKPINKEEGKPDDQTAIKKEPLDDDDRNPWKRRNREFSAESSAPRKTKIKKEDDSDEDD